MKLLGRKPGVSGASPRQPTAPLKAEPRLWRGVAAEVFFLDKQQI